ncbi:hypothetical protein GWI33_021505 [Rhynchophorus ferrugineus]|uniref:Uncharacterized protein n=1 Tax=Rhynchophorus ferrugineus TaxID=354439 RepID=A0A834J169_RHYFE|nr:hypothetical protein GWI33_021505 [Rhynchophorus ferrugineus]
MIDHFATSMTQCAQISNAADPNPDRQIPITRNYLAADAEPTHEWERDGERQQVGSDGGGGGESARIDSPGVLAGGVGLSACQRGIAAVLLPVNVA